MFLFTGYNSVGIFSSDGKEIGNIHLDTPPITSPIIADFNNDGQNDIIIITRNSIEGYILKPITGSLLLQILIGMLLLVMVVIWMTVALDTNTYANPQTGRIKRSTD